MTTSENIAALKQINQLIDTRNHGEAWTACQKLFSMNPYDFPALTRIIVLCIESNNLEFGKRILEQLLKSNPDYTKLHLLFSLIYEKQGSWDLLKKSILIFLADWPNHPKALILYARVLQKFGNSIEFMETINKILSFDLPEEHPFKMDAKKLLAMHYTEVREIQKSIDLLLNLLTLAPSDQFLHVLIGDAYTENSDYLNAAKYYKAFIDHNFDHLVFNKYIYTQIQLNNLSECIDLLLKNPDTRNALTRIYLLSFAYLCEKKNTEFHELANTYLFSKHTIQIITAPILLGISRIFEVFDTKELFDKIMSNISELNTMSATSLFSKIGDEHFASFQSLYYTDINPKPFLEKANLLLCSEIKNQPEIVSTPSVKICLVYLRNDIDLFLLLYGHLIKQWKAFDYPLTIALSPHGFQKLKALELSPHIELLELPIQLDKCVEALNKEEFGILYFHDLYSSIFSYLLAMHKFSGQRCISLTTPITSGSKEFTLIYPSAFDKQHVEDSYSESLVTMDSLCIAPELPSQLPIHTISRSDLGIDDSAHLYFFPHSLEFLDRDSYVIFQEILTQDSRAHLLFFDFYYTGIPLQKHVCQGICGDREDYAKRVHFTQLDDNRENILSLFCVADAILDCAHCNNLELSLLSVYTGTPLIHFHSQELKESFSYLLYKKLGIQGCSAENSAHFVKIALNLFEHPGFIKSLHNQLIAGHPCVFNNQESVDAFSRCFDQIIRSGMYKN